MHSCSGGKAAKGNMSTETCPSCRPCLGAAVLQASTFRSRDGFGSAGEEEGEAAMSGRNSCPHAPPPVPAQTQAPLLQRKLSSSFDARCGRHGGAAAWGSEWLKANTSQASWGCAQSGAAPTLCPSKAPESCEYAYFGWLFPFVLTIWCSSNLTCQPSVAGAHGD